MLQQIMDKKMVGSLAGLLLLLVASSPIMADQVILSYIGSDGSTETLSIDADSVEGDLAKVAEYLDEYGASVAHNPNAGTGSLADIAEAMAKVSPMFAADIAQALAALDPKQTEAIVAAVNSVPGVDAEAVLSAVHFGPPIRIVVPPTDKGVAISDGLPIIEKPVSKN